MKWVLLFLFLFTGFSASASAVYSCVPATIGQDCGTCSCVNTTTMNCGTCSCTNWMSDWCPCTTCSCTYVVCGTCSCTKTGHSHATPCITTDEHGVNTTHPWTTPVSCTNTCGTATGAVICGAANGTAVTSPIGAVVWTGTLTRWPCWPLHRCTNSCGTWDRNTIHGQWSTCEVNWHSCAVGRRCTNNCGTWYNELGNNTCHVTGTIVTGRRCQNLCGVWDGGGGLNSCAITSTVQPNPERDCAVGVERATCQSGELAICRTTCADSVRGSFCETCIFD